MDAPADTSISISEAEEQSNSSTWSSVLSVTLKNVPSETTPTYTYNCKGGYSSSDSEARVSAVVSVKGMYLYVCA